MRNFNVWSEYCICYIMCVCMYAEIMWGCSYTCMYVRCVHIRTNANIVSVRTRLTVVSLSEPILAIRLTSGCMYLSLYLCVHRCPPKPPTHAHKNLTPIIAHFLCTVQRALDVKDSSYKLTVLPHF